MQKKNLRSDNYKMVTKPSHTPEFKRCFWFDSFACAADRILWHHRETQNKNNQKYRLLLLFSNTPEENKNQTNKTEQTNKINLIYFKYS